MEKLIFKKLKLFSESTKFQNDLIRQLDKQKIKSPHHLYETLNLKPIYNALKCWMPITKVCRQYIIK